MTDTKTVYLRLQTPRLQVFCAALEKKILEGWEISIPAREGNTMFTLTLSKEVSIDSELPTKAVWSCKDEFEPEVLEEGNIAVIEAQELTEPPYPPLDTLELIPVVNLLQEELVEAGFTVRQEGTVKSVLIEGVVKSDDEITKPTKSPNGFELREYSLEEVQKLNWQELTKLNADLGLQKGKKPDMEVNIVEASKIQWGSK